jgi:CelD/BcsL family acetyltransferase involved in cellulose biosynthesis
MTDRVEIFRSIEDARDTWLSFEERGDLYVFQTVEWLENWHHHVGRKSGVEPCLVAVYDGTEPLYFFPLAVARKGFVNALVWLGGEFSDYGAPIVVSKALEASGADDFPRVWDEVLRRIPPVDVVWLVRIPERINGRLNPMTLLKCAPYHSRAHAATPAGTWDQFYEAHAGPKTRSTDRRKTRRLEETGAVTCTITDGRDEAAFRRITEAMIEQKEKRYREIRARNIFESEDKRAFFLRPVESLVRTGRLNLSDLSVDGKVITTHWGMVYRGRFYYFMPSFAPGPWTRFSPGRLLLFRLFQWCIDQGVEVLDFTVGDEAYKADWRDEELPLYECFSARTAKGRIFGVVHAAYSGVARNRRLLDAARRFRRLVYGVRYGRS